MQTIYHGKKAVKVVRSFSPGLDKPMVILDELGNYRYMNGDLVKTKTELDFLPEPHKTNALKWLRSKTRKVEKKEEPKEELSEGEQEEVDRDEQLLNMPIPQLQILAGSAREDRDELIKIIQGEEV